MRLESATITGMKKKQILNIKTIMPIKIFDKIKELLDIKPPYLIAPETKQKRICEKTLLE